jgi:hypothetical protein
MAEREFYIIFGRLLVKSLLKLLEIAIVMNGGDFISYGTVNHTWSEVVTA